MTLNRPTKTVILIHAAAEWGAFHRRSMLSAMEKSLPSGTALLGVNRPISPDVALWKHPRKFFSGFWKLGIDLDKLGMWYVTPRLLLHERIAASVPHATTVNRRLLRSQIHKAVKKVYPEAENIIQWIYHPAQRWVWDLFPEGGKIYECYDDYPRAFGEFNQSLWMEEQTVLKESDLAFVTADVLLKAREGYASQIRMLPNGVPDFFFEPATDSGGDPIQAISRPRIGYLGNVFAYIDYHLLERVFTSRPDWQLILVGPIEKNSPISKLRQMTNVHFIGRRPFEEVPAVLGQMDVGLIPFLVDDFTRAINPLKLYEYLATGLPIVASRLPELERFDKLVRLSDSRAGDFEKAIAESLADNNTAWRDARVAAARPYSWTQIVQRHVIPALQDVWGI